MIRQSDIEALERLDSRGALVLSAYLDLDPERHARRTYRIAFEDLTRELREKLAKPGRAALEREAERVTQWLETQKPQGKGLALFASAPRQLWQAHWLAVRVPDHAAFEPLPDLAPLLDALDEYERYAVALADREHARLFTVFMGEIEEGDELEDSLVRRDDAHVLHLQRVARRLAELSRRRHFDRLILAGPEEAAHELRRRLPRALASRLVAVTPLAMDASAKEILEKTLAVERLAERDFEQRLLDELIEQSGPAGRAIHGISPTLAALWAREVHTLVAAERTHVEGSECPSCGRLEKGAVERCPACGEKMEPMHDLFHRALTEALRQSAKVDVVHGEAARRLIEVGQGLGALLRFRVPVDLDSGR